jgi:hypothetical protein
LRWIVFLSSDNVCFRFTKKFTFFIYFYLQNFFPILFLFFSLSLSIFLFPLRCPTFCLRVLYISLAQPFFERDVTPLKSKFCELPQSVFFPFFVLNLLYNLCSNPENLELSWSWTDSIFGCVWVEPFTQLTPIIFKYNILICFASHFFLLYLLLNLYIYLIRFYFFL